MTERCRVTGLVRRGEAVAGVTLDDGRWARRPTSSWSRPGVGRASWPAGRSASVRRSARSRASPFAFGPGSRSAPLRRTVRGLVHGRSCYLVPRTDGSLVVGATVEERGFDLTVEAGPVGDLLG